MEKFAFEEMIPLGRSTYAEIAAAVALPVVVPGRTMLLPESVPPIPRSVATAEPMLSVKVAPLAAAAAALLNDQRFVGCAGATGPTTGGTYGV